MVCFDILIGYPLGLREKSNIVFAQRIVHLRRHYNVDEKSSYQSDTMRYIRVSVCNEDAIGFLRDLPHPTCCLWIRLLHEGALLYSNFKATGDWIGPPKDILCKRVYWMASSLEKWQPRFTLLPRNIQ